jgi:hypothetical protein
MQWKIVIVVSSLIALAFTAAIAASFDLNLVQGRTGYSDSFFRKWYSEKPTEGEIIDLAIDTDPFFRGRDTCKSKWREFADKGFLLHFVTSDGRTIVVGPYDPTRKGAPYLLSRVVWLTEPSTRLEVPTAWMCVAIWTATWAACLVFFTFLFGVPVLWHNSLPGLYLKRRRLEELQRVDELSSQFREQKSLETKGCEPEAKPAPQQLNKVNTRFAKNRERRIYNEQTVVFILSIPLIYLVTAHVIRTFMSN